MASAVGLPSGSAFPDGDYCILYCLNNEYVRKGQICYTQGAGGSLERIVDDARAAVEAERRRIILLISCSSAGALLLLAGCALCYCKVRCRPAQTTAMFTGRRDALTLLVASLHILLL